MRLTDKVFTNFPWGPQIHVRVETYEFKTHKKHTKKLKCNIKNETKGKKEYKKIRNSF